MTACRSCNQKKADKTLREVDMVLRQKPREPSWLQKIGVEINPEKAPDSWRIYLFDAEEAG